MTIQNEACATEWQSGNGVLTAWPFEFNIPSRDAVKVIVRDVATLTETVIASNQFDIDDADLDNDEGGTVEYPLSGDPLSDDYQLIIVRDAEYSQETSFGGAQGSNSPRVLEERLDYVTMLTQQNKRDVDRAVKVPFNGSPPSMTTGLLDGDFLRVLDGRITGATGDIDSLIDAFVSGLIPYRVNTVANLIALEPPGGNSALMPLWMEVRGVDDGMRYIGGGVFYWDSASTATHDGTFVIQPTFFAGNPGRYKRVGNPDVLHAFEFGCVDDGSWYGNAAGGVGNAATGTDNYDAIMRMIDAVQATNAETVDFLGTGGGTYGAIGPWATVGAARLYFPRARTGIYGVGQTIVRPSEKNFHFVGPEGARGSALMHLDDIADWKTPQILIDWAPANATDSASTGNGAGNNNDIGLRHMALLRGSMRIIGNQNNYMGFDQFGIYGAPGKALHIIDSGDISGYAGQMPGGINAVHMNMGKFEIAHCYQGLYFEAGTYVLFRCNSGTLRAIYDTPVTFDAYGGVLRDLHIMGVISDTAPLMWFPCTRNANTNILVENVNFGTEGGLNPPNLSQYYFNWPDSNDILHAGDTVPPSTAVESDRKFHPPERSILIGPRDATTGESDTAAAAPSGAGAGHFTFRKITAGGAHDGTTKHFLEVAIGSVDGILIDDCQFAHYKDSLILESAVRDGFGPTLGGTFTGTNIIDGLNCSEELTGGVIFSHGGQGWQTPLFRQGNVGTRGRIGGIVNLRPGLEDLSGTRWTRDNVTVALDAADRAGTSNAAWTVTRGADYTTRTITVTSTNPVKISSANLTADGLVVADKVHLSGFTGAVGTAFNDKRFAVVAKSGDEFTLAARWPEGEATQNGNAARVRSSTMTSSAIAAHTGGCAFDIWTKAGTASQRRVKVRGQKASAPAHRYTAQHGFIVPDGRWRFMRLPIQEIEAGSSPQFLLDFTELHPGETVLIGNETACWSSDNPPALPLMVGTKAHDFPSIGAGVTLTTSITTGLTAARAGDIVLAIHHDYVPTTNSLIFQAVCTTAGQVELYVTNPTAGAIDPGSINFEVVVAPKRYMF